MGHSHSQNSYKPEHQLRDIRSMLKIILPEPISVFHIDMVCKTICRTENKKKEPKKTKLFVSASDFHKEYLLNSTPNKSTLQFKLEN